MSSEKAFTRVCAKCGQSDFGTRNRCNPCRASAAREKWAANLPTARAEDSRRHRSWRAANPDKSRAQDLRKRYAMAPSEFTSLLERQSGACAICAAPNPDCVDHCHRTGVVRGLLCRSCNAGLGQFRDDPDRLRAAASYLESIGIRTPAIAEG